jgi:hypothetical protein
MRYRLRPNKQSEAERSTAVGRTTLPSSSRRHPFTKVTLAPKADNSAGDRLPIGALDFGDLARQLLVTLVQGLEPKLPAVKLDTELFDVSADLGALRFVFL